MRTSRAIGWRLCLAAIGTMLPLLGGGCTGPCDEACSRLVVDCHLAADSYSAATVPDAARGCDEVEPGRDLDLALCEEQCQEWKPEGAECMAALECGGDLAANERAATTCLDERGRENGERDLPPAETTDCRRDCDRQAVACGEACTTTHGDVPTCAGCFDNCDRARARCRGWCKLIGQ